MHRTPLQIRFNDIDVLGHVNNVVFGHYYDLAKTDYFLHKTTYNPIFGKDEKLIIMVHAEHDYLAPCFLTDTLFVETTLVKVGERSLHFLQEIVDDKGVVRSRSRSVMSTFNTTTGKSFPIKGEWEFFEQ